MKIDIVIPVKTSIVRLTIEKTIPSVLLNLSYKQIFIVTKKANFPQFLSAFEDKIRLIDENNIVDGLTLDKVKDYFESKNANKERAGWYFQQFLKLGIAKSNIISGLYLVWEADNVALKPISFFSQDNKVLCDPSLHYHKPYFEHIERLIKIKRQVDYSFISDHFVFDKNIVLNLLNQISDKTGSDWWIKILEKIDPSNLSGSGFSEYELYGNFLVKNYPDYFKVRELKKTREGSYLLGMNPNKFSLFIFSLVFDYIIFEEWHDKCKPLLRRYKEIIRVLRKTM